MIQFQNPTYAWPVIVVGLLWSLGYWRIFNRVSFAIPSKYLQERRMPIRVILFLIAVAGWILVAAAVAGPREQLGKKESKKKINDIVFVLDISGSMRTVDFTPNRLEAAKEKIINFIEMRPKDRIGVIIFGQKAFTLLPLTTDLELIRRSIQEIDFNYAGIGSGTNIGDAIGLAVARCALSEAKNKTIILLTDGVSNSGSLTPLQAAKEAGSQGIKIHVIGIGSSGERSQMPVVDQRGQIRTDRWGNVLMQQTPGGGIDSDTMLEISMITGGSLHQANDGDGLKNVFENIDKLERTAIKSLAEYNYKEHYYKLLLSGILLLLFVEFMRRLVLKEGL